MTELNVAMRTSCSMERRSARPAAATMLAIAVRMNQNEQEFGTGSAPTSHGWQAKWVLVLALRWVFLLFGVAAPTAFRTLDSDR